MSNVFMQNLIFFIWMFTWTTYLVQELFVSGSGAINMFISENEGERKQIQVATGVHWDGIEVWLLATLTMMLAAFPEAFAMTFEFLYVPIYLLLFALIGRGTSIELIYKLDSKKWIKAMTITWTVSSILIVLILGVYMTNMFLGYNLDGGVFNGSFIDIFSVASVMGGLFFVGLSFIAGAAWVNIRTEGPISEKALLFVKKYGIIYVPVVTLMITMMGINNLDTSIFAGELYNAHFFLYIFPLLAVIAAIMVIIKGLQQNGKYMFVMSMASLGFFIISGFIGMFPNVVQSQVSFPEGWSIAELSTSRNNMTVILVAVLVFYPIVFGYQSWKYKKFTERIKFNDE